MMKRANMHAIHKTKDQFFNYTLTQQSEIIKNSKNLKAKFSVVAFFKEDIGMIKIRDF